MSPSRTLPRRRFVLSLLAAAGLPGCGGGGGDGGGGGGGLGPGDPPLVGPAWPTFGRDSQHSALSAAVSQDLNRVAWSMGVDEQPEYTPAGAIQAHYGSPVVSDRNTVVAAVKKSTEVGFPPGGFRVEARAGDSGALLWAATSDYLSSPGNWDPAFNMVITPQRRLYIPGAGGKLLVRENVDLVDSPWSAVVVYSAPAYYANQQAYERVVFVNTPLIANAQGHVYYGYQVTGPNPLALPGAFARVGPNGEVRWVSVATVASDPTIDKVATNSAPALSHDGSTVYVVVNRNADQTGYLLALDSTHLGLIARVALTDPRTGALARISDDASSSPVVGPDGRVYVGVLEAGAGSHNGRGWLLQFTSVLLPAGVPGSFGADATPTIIPTSMVPSYTPSSSYLLALAYNNPNGVGTGNGLNRLAVLDPSAVQADAYSPINVMREAITVLSPTLSGASGARTEWTANSMAADPARRLIFAVNEDGKLYRWDTSTNTLSQSIQLTAATGKTPTPTLVGPEGSVYAISNARLHAVRS